MRVSCAPQVPAGAGAGSSVRLGARGRQERQVRCVGGPSRQRRLQWNLNGLAHHTPPTSGAVSSLATPRVLTRPAGAGEKKLRSLLSRTAEWGSDATRLEAAAEAEAAGDGVLGALLRSRDASALRKLHILALCRRWRYRADAWVPREAARKRARDDTQAPQAAKRRQTAPPSAADRLALAQALELGPCHAAARGGPQQQLQPPSISLPQAADEALRGALRRQLQTYIFSTNDARVHAASLREPHAPLVTWTVPMLDSMLSVIRGFSSVTDADGLALAARSSAVGPGDGGDAMRWTPWWLSEDHELLVRTDAHFALLQVMLQAMFAGLRSLRRPGAPALSAPDAAIADGWAGSLTALDALISLSQSSLAHARLSLPTAGYVRVAAEALTALSAAGQHMLRLFESRRAWTGTREASLAIGMPMQGNFWPAVATAARERVIPSATYTQPRLTYALEGFAATFHSWALPCE